MKYRPKTRYKIQNLMLIVPQQTAYTCDFVKCTKLKIILLNYERK